MSPGTGAASRADAALEVQQVLLNLLARSGVGACTSEPGAARLAVPCPRAPPR